MAARAVIALLALALHLPSAAAQIVPGGPGGSSPDDKPPPAGGPPLGTPPSAPQPQDSGGTGGATGGAGGSGDSGGAAAPAATPAQAAPRKPGDKPEPLPGEPRCGWCNTTGKVAFEVGKQRAVEEDHGEGWKLAFCSDAIDGANEGIDWMPCPNCKTPSLKALADNEYANLTAANAAWMKERRRTDELAQAGKPLVHVQTSHFCITTDVPRVTTADKKIYRTHEMAHLYARRLEELYVKYKAMFGITDKNNMVNIHYFFIFEKEQQQALAGPIYTGLSGGPTVRRSGGAKDISALVSFWDKAEYPKDQDMYRHQIHNTIHQLTAVYYDLSWFKPNEFGLSPPWLNDRYGWLDEGLAHWFEIDFDGIANTYCFREQDTQSRWGGMDWRKNIFKAVAAGDIPPFAELTTKSSQALSAKEHQFVWSWVDFLMHRDQLAFGKAMKLCKQKVETRDIIKQAWNLTMLDFTPQWVEFVQQNYAPSNKGR